MKPAQSTITSENLCLKSAKVFIEKYSEKFQTVGNEFSKTDLQNHYQYEVIADMFN